MEQKIRDVLDMYGRIVAEKIKQKIQQTGTVDTGALYYSVTFKIENNRLEFEMLDYGQYTDQGTMYIKPPRHFFEQVIEENLEEIERAVLDVMAEEFINQIN